MGQPLPVLTIELFPELSQSLLALLETLPDGAWQQPTACPGWTVKDVALHLLGGNIGLLSRGRDGYIPQAAGRPIDGWDDLVALIDSLNAQWVQAARRISPRLLCELLRFTDPMVYDHLRSLDPHVAGSPVSWAGPDPAPVWLDIAREYTERWHHQQHIREAVDRPGLMAPRYLSPVLATFLRALPHTYRAVAAAVGTSLDITIAGEAGGVWHLRRTPYRWDLHEGASGRPDATVQLPQSIAWRLFTAGVSPREVRHHITLTGDPALTVPLLRVVAILARPDDDA